MIVLAIGCPPCRKKSFVKSKRPEKLSHNLVPYAAALPPFQHIDPAIGARSSSALVSLPCSGDVPLLHAPWRFLWRNLQLDLFRTPDDSQRHPYSDLLVGQQPM